MNSRVIIDSIFHLKVPHNPDAVWAELGLEEREDLLRAVNVDPDEAYRPLEWFTVSRREIIQALLRWRGKFKESIFHLKAPDFIHFITEEAGVPHYEYLVNRKGQAWNKFFSKSQRWSAYHPCTILGLSNDVWTPGAALKIEVPLADLFQNPQQMVGQIVLILEAGERSTLVGTVQSAALVSAAKAREIMGAEASLLVSESIFHLKKAPDEREVEEWWDTLDMHVEGSSGFGYAKSRSVLRELGLDEIKPMRSIFDPSTATPAFKTPYRALTVAYKEGVRRAYQSVNESIFHLKPQPMNLFYSGVHKFEESIFHLKRPPNFFSKGDRVLVDDPELNDFAGTVVGPDTNEENTVFVRDQNDEVFAVHTSYLKHYYGESIFHLKRPDLNELRRSKAEEEFEKIDFGGGVVDDEAGWEFSGMAKEFNPALWRKVVFVKYSHLPYTLAHSVRVIFHPNTDEVEKVELTQQ